VSVDLEPVASDTPDFIAALEAEHLPVDDLAESGRLFFRFKRDGAAVGFGGIELCGTNILLRSIVVLPQARGQGIGRLITESLLERAIVLGTNNAYLLTTSATDFFEAMGFKQIQRDFVPAEVLATKQASSLCPSTATFLAHPVSKLTAPLASNTKEIIS
jgi:N-acetylglutamate synthase-like GNAT family acetyltransferase